MADEKQPDGRQQRAEDVQEEQDKPRGEQEARPKDLDPKGQGKDVKGGGVRAFSDARLKQRVQPL